MFKYKVGTELIDIDGECVIIKDTDIDRHSYKKDYYLLVTNGVKHTTGSVFWVQAQVVEAFFRELTPQEKVLFGS